MLKDQSKFILSLLVEKIFIFLGLEEKIKKMEILIETIPNHVFIKNKKKLK